MRLPARHPWRRVRRRGRATLLVDLDADRLEAARERHGEKVTTVAVDVTDPEQTKGMVDRCLAEFGHIDGLVNSAGILNEVALVDMDVATWDQMIKVDLRSAFLSCRWAVPHMVEHGSGRIINIASQLGLRAARASCTTAPQRPA